MKQLKNKIYILLLLLLQLTYASGSEAFLPTTKNTIKEFVLSIHKQHTVNKAGNKLPDLTIDILAKPQLLTKFVEKPNLIDAWKVLQVNPNSFIKTDAARLEIFHKLSSENQQLIRQFTDNKANSTLAKFLDDCDADPDFLNFINNSDNALEVKGFLAHKEGMLTADENRLIAEMLENSDKILTYVIKESNVINEIDNDFVASIGSVSIGFYFDENINLLGGDNGKVLATKIYWRIWDSFNFIDDHNWYSFFIKSQPLGNWQREIFKQNPTSPSIGFGLINNDFINIYKKIHDIDISSKKSNQKPNFSIITKYQEINNDLWVVSFYRYITGGCKCQIFKYE